MKADDAKWERRERWNERVAFAVAGLTLAIAAITLTNVLSGNTAQKAQIRSDAIDSCRSSYAADYESATVDLLIARARSDDLIRQGFAAVAIGDRDQLREVAGRAAPASEEVADALDALADAEEDYADAVERAEDDADAFLERCREEGRALVSGSSARPSVTFPTVPGTSTTTAPPSSPTASAPVPPSTATTVSTDQPSPAPTTSSTAPPDAVDDPVEELRRLLRRNLEPAADTSTVSPSVTRKEHRHEARKARSVEGRPVRQGPRGRPADAGRRGR